MYDYYDGHCFEHLYMDLNGNPVKKTPRTHPYSYDDYVLYKSEDFDPMDSMVYHDRMMQWDREAFGKATREVWPKGSWSNGFAGKTAEDINRFLNLYFGKEVKLTAVLQGCNFGNGFPYWVFAYKKLKSAESVN